MDQDKVLQVADDQINFLDRMSAQHRTRLETAIERLERRITDRLTLLDTDNKGSLIGPKTNLSQAQKIHSDLSQIFDEEYGEGVRKTIKEYSEALPIIQEQYKEMGEAAKFTGIDKDMIQTLKTRDLNEYSRYGVQAQDQIATALYDHVVAQSPFSSLRAAIAGALIGHVDARGRPMSSYAKQMANDGIMNFHNAVNLKKGQDLGFTHFLYIGNIIADSRDFCVARAGNVYTKEQIDSWTFPWKGKSGPAMTHRGGFNCRHHWQPVRKEWVPEGGIEVQSFFDRAGVMPVSKLPAAVTGAPKFKAYQAWQQSILIDKKPLTAVQIAEKVGGNKAATTAWLSHWEKGFDLPKGWQSVVRDLEAEVGGFGRVVLDSGPTPQLSKIFDKEAGLRALAAIPRTGFSGKPSASGKYIQSQLAPTDAGKRLELTVSKAAEKIKADTGDNFLPALEKSGYVTNETLNINKLTGWQPAVSVEKVEGILSSVAIDEPIVVIRVGDTNLVWDGYHRLNANILGGSPSINAKVYHLDNYAKKIPIEGKATSSAVPESLVANKEVQKIAKDALASAREELPAAFTDYQKAFLELTGETVDSLNEKKMAVPSIETAASFSRPSVESLEEVFFQQIVYKNEGHFVPRGFITPSRRKIWEAEANKKAIEVFGKLDAAYDKVRSNAMAILELEQNPVFDAIKDVNEAKLFYDNAIAKREAFVSYFKHNGIDFRTYRASGSNYIQEYHEAATYERTGEASLQDKLRKAYFTKLFEHEKLVKRARYQWLNQVDEATYIAERRKVTDSIVEFDWQSKGKSEKWKREFQERMKARAAAGTDFVPVDLLDSMAESGYKIRVVDKVGRAEYNGFDRMATLFSNDDATVFAHEWGHAIDGFFTGTGQTGGNWGMGGAKFEGYVTKKDGDQYRTWFNRQHSGKKGKFKNGDGFYFDNNWITSYEGRIYQGRGVGQEWWAMNIQRYSSYHINLKMKRLEARMNSGIVKKEELEEYANSIFAIGRRSSGVTEFNRARKMYPELTDFIEKTFGGKRTMLYKDGEQYWS